MTRKRAPAVIVQMPQTCGSLAFVERADEYAYSRAAADYHRRQREKRRREIKQRKIAFVVAVITIAAILAAFMPWDGGRTATEAFRIQTEQRTLETSIPADIVTQDKPVYIPDAVEVEALAKLIYGEAGVVPSTTERAAVVWCVLNRVDDPRFPDTVLEVITAPYQFSGYSPDNPATDKFKALAADVLTRYQAERDGEEAVGRVLPADHCFFVGDGKRNYFTTIWQGSDVWGWTLESPYED